MRSFSNFIVAILSLCGLGNASAQVVADNAPWCPTGATWTYKHGSRTSVLYFKFSYEKDTTINNISAKKLAVERIEYLGSQPGQGRTVTPAGAEFLAERGDSIFAFNSSQNDFEFMYNFAANVGDTFVIGNPRLSCPFNANYPLADTVLVTSVAPQTFINRSFQVISTSTDGHYQLGAVVAKIGSLVSPFPILNTAQRCTTSIIDGSPAQYEGLVCYSDSIRGRVQFSTTSDGECHDIETIVAKLSPNNPYALFPNPTNGRLNIANTDNLPVSEVRIYSANGAEILTLIAPNIAELDVAELPAGLYFAKLSNAENKASLLRFVKF